MTVSPFFINEFSIRNENSPHSTIPTIPTISTIDDRLLFSGTLMSTAVKILRGSKQLSFENGAIKLSITLKLNVKSDLDNAKLIVTIADRKIGTINQSPTPSAPVKFQATLNPFRNPNINYQEVLKKSEYFFSTEVSVIIGGDSNSVDNPLEIPVFSNNILVNIAKELDVSPNE